MIAAAASYSHSRLLRSSFGRRIARVNIEVGIVEIGSSTSRVQREIIGIAAETNNKEKSSVSDEHAFDCMFLLSLPESECDCAFVVVN